MSHTFIVGKPASSRKGTSASDLIDLVVLAPPGTGKTWSQGELNGRRFDLWKINVIDTDQCFMWGSEKNYKCAVKDPRTSEEAVAIINFCFRRHVDPSEINILFTNVHSFYRALFDTTSSLVVRAPLSIVESDGWLAERGYDPEELERFRGWQREAALNPLAHPLPHQKLSDAILYLLSFNVKENVVRIEPEENGGVRITTSPRVRTVE